MEEGDKKLVHAPGPGLVTADGQPVSDILAAQRAEKARQEEERKANAWKQGIPFGSRIKLWGKWFVVHPVQKYRDALMLGYDKERTEAAYRKQEQQRQAAQSKKAKQSNRAKMAKRSKRKNRRK